LPYKVLEDLISSLTTEFKLTYKGDVGAYLGIDIKHRQDVSLELLQQGLIQKVITAAGLESNSAQHDTPATAILHDDPTGSEREHNWNYRAVIGMLNYLASSTQPDITFAIHKCARFCTNPKRLHELAVHCIVRYLKGTSNKGYLLHPTKSSLNLDCYADTDFAGLWTLPTSSDPISVKSRTCYVLTFASCPLLWSSMLQSKVAFSTTEAKYIALSQATRDIIPLQNLLHEFASVTKLIVGQTITHSTIFEDNKGCVELANAPRLCPHTHHIGFIFVIMLPMETLRCIGLILSINLQTFSLNLFLLLPSSFFATFCLVGDFTIRGSASTSLHLHTIVDCLVRCDFLFLRGAKTALTDERSFSLASLWTFSVSRLSWLL